MRAHQPRQARYPVYLAEAAWRKAALAAILALSFLAAVSHAQGFRGSMAGAVMDSSGGRVQAAEVRLQATESSIERQTKSDSRGEFHFTDLLPGAYTVTVRAKGFAEASSTVSVTVSSAREISVTLQPAAAQQRLEGPAQASSIITQPVDSSSAVHGGVVTARDLQTIPLAHRSFANIPYRSEEHTSELQSPCNLVCRL